MGINKIHKRSARSNKKVSGNDDNDKMDTDDQEPQFDPNDDGPLALPFGQLFFGFPVVLPKHPEEEEEKPSHVFAGAGQTLRGKKGTKRDGGKLSKLLLL